MNNNYYLNISTTYRNAGVWERFSYGLQIINYEWFYVKWTEDTGKDGGPGNSLLSLYGKNISSINPSMLEYIKHSIYSLQWFLCKDILAKIMI